MITAGKQQYLFDETGRRYLDCFAGIVTVSCGHCHPTVRLVVVIRGFVCFLCSHFWRCVVRFRWMRRLADSCIS